jgi:hypothetical protein
MKVDQDSVEKQILGKMIHFERKTFGRKSSSLLNPLPQSVNPLFGLAHHALYYSASSFGGRRREHSNHSFGKR